MDGKILKKIWLPSLLLLTACQITPKESGPVQPLSGKPADTSSLPLLVHQIGKELGVRKAGENFQALRTTDVIPGVFILNSGKIIRLSNLNLQPGKENSVVINATDFTLAPLAAQKLLLVESDMPTMPEMGGPFPAVLNRISATETEATIDIAHGGYWEVRLEFEGAPKEVLRLGIDIPKGRPRNQEPN